MSKFLESLLAISLVASLALVACSQAAPTSEKSGVQSSTAKPAETKSETKAAEAIPDAAKPEQKPAAGSSASSSSSAQKARIRLPVLEGTQAFIFQVMQQQGYVDKYNIALDQRPAASADAINTALLSKEADIVVTGWLTAALYRTQGKDVRVVYAFGMPDTNVIVKKDSPIKGFGDLKGKKIGIYGGPAAATTGLFRAICSKFFGFEPSKDSEVNFGAAPLMGNMLDKGEVDAILMLNPQLTKMLLTGQYRDLGNLGTVWKEKTSMDVMNTAVVTSDSFAKENPAAVKGFIKAMAEAVTYAKSHPEIWPGLAKSVGIDTPEGAEILRKQQVNIWFDKMDQKFIGDQKQYAETLINILGKDFLPSYQEDIFSTDYLQ